MNKGRSPLNRLELQPARNRALEIIRSLKIRGPEEIEIKEIAVHRGAFVQFKPLSGYLGRRIKKTITIDSKIRNLGRERFTLAHELGHYELHNDPGRFCENDDLYKYHNQKPQERESNTFASEILMPAPLFKPYFDEEELTWELIDGISTTFRTSLTATARRVAELSLDCCVLVVSEQGERSWSRGSSSFYEKGFQLREQLHGNSYANELLEKCEDQKSGECAASAWLQGLSTDEEFPVFEDSLALRSHNQILTLLSLRLDDDEDEW
jgi:Zn-dependent peptidase ImmA (M78 family)